MPKQFGMNKEVSQGRCITPTVAKIFVIKTVIVRVTKIMEFADDQVK